MFDDACRLAELAQLGTLRLRDEVIPKNQHEARQSQVSPLSFCAVVEILACLTAALHSIMLTLGRKAAGALPGLAHMMSLQVREQVCPVQGITTCNM